MTLNFAVVSRHQPTDAQIEIARRKNIKLVYLGDYDAFTITPEWISDKGEFKGVIVVHGAAVARLLRFYDVGIFENSNRVEADQPLDYVAGSLHVYTKDGIEY